MTSAGIAAAVEGMEDVDLERHECGIGRAGQRIEERALGRRRELVAVAVIGEAQPGLGGGLPEPVERLGGAERRLARERSLVWNPRTHGPGRAERLRFGEPLRRLVAQALERQVRGLAAQPGRVERAAQIADRGPPQPRALDFLEAQRPHLRERSPQVLWQIFA